MLYAVELKSFAGQLVLLYAVCCRAVVFYWAGQLVLLYAVELKSSAGQLVLLCAVELKSSSGQLV